MVDRLFAVDVHRGLLTRCQYLHIDPPTGQGLLGRFEGSGIPVAALVVATVAAHTIHRVPGVGKVHVLPVLRNLSWQARVLSNKFSAPIQIDDVAHDIAPCTERFYRVPSLKPHNAVLGNLSQSWENIHHSFRTAVRWFFELSLIVGIRKIF